MSAPSKPLTIVCATSVAGGKEAFETIGRVLSIPESEINAATLRGVDVLVTRSKVQVNEVLLEGASLSFYGTATAGFDHVDVAALDRRNIAWSQAPGSNANSVAEYILAALSWLGKKQDIDWSGRALGIIGAGQVGSRLADVAEAFGLNVLLNDPPLKDRTGDSRYHAISELLERSDILSLHVPLIDDGPYPTRGMVDAEFIAAMKPGSVFINASRGEVVVESALVPAIAKGVFSAVILDVFEHEPDISIDTLNVAALASPHIAGYSLDGRLKGTAMIYQAVCRHFELEPKWQIPEVLSPVKLNADSTLKRHHSLFDLILKAYNPALDDQRLRSLPVGMPMRKHFSSLRQNYPERREFRHFSIAGDKLEKKLAAALLKIGFKVQSGA